MAQMLRLTALAAASAAAFFAGSAFGLAQEKERIGVDNADKCDMAMRDPDCANDSIRSDVRYLVPFTGEPDPFARVEGTGELSPFARSEDNRDDRHESQG
jgi:hypothetical protein